MLDEILGVLRDILSALNRRRVQSPWLTATEADAYVHQSHSTVGRLCKAGIIKSRKIGGTRFVHTDWLDEWMESQPSGADPQFAALR